MTVLTIPQEVAADCAEKLLALAAAANRDAMTLTKQAMVLARNERPSRALMILRKYVREYHQYESGEVAKIIAAIEAAGDPEIIKRMARGIAMNDATRAKRREPPDPPLYLNPGHGPRPVPYWDTKPPEVQEPRRNGNVIDGPWAS